MCGITGIGNWRHVETVKRMCHVQVHRRGNSGPAGDDGDRGMEGLLQPRPPAWRIGLPKPRLDCQNYGATRTSPRNLTFQLAQKGISDDQA